MSREVRPISRPVELQPLMRGSVSSDSPRPRVLVMMATYNGAEYLVEQIDSILSQAGVDVTLWVRDDQSRDETMEVLNRYAKKCASVEVRQNRQRQGVGMNFMQMVYEADPGEFDYYAFSDQDDVWLPEKLETAIDEIESRVAEGASRVVKGLGTPVLYCSDICDVDADLKNPRHELSHLPRGENYRASLLVRNYYYGCTMVFNAPLLRLAQIHPLAKFNRIHDVWIALLAYYCGNLVVDREHALILRRITGDNVAGVIAPGTDVRKASISNIIKVPEREATATARQLLAYSDYMSDKNRTLIESFSTYADSLGGRLKWAFSNEYKSLSFWDTLLVRVKFLLGRY